MDIDKNRIAWVTFDDKIKELDDKFKDYLINTDCNIEKIEFDLSDLMKEIQNSKELTNWQICELLKRAKGVLNIATDL